MRKGRSRQAASQSQNDDGEDANIESNRGQFTYDRDELFESDVDQDEGESELAIYDSSKNAIGLELSDEEVLALSNESDLEDDEESEVEYQEDLTRDDLDQQQGYENSDDDEKPGENDKDHKWGTRKSVYYGADDVSDEEDVVEEEKEALRLQRRELERLTEEDFVDSWTSSRKQNNEQGVMVGVHKERLPEIDFKNLSAQELDEIVTNHHPDLLRYGQTFRSLYKIHLQLTLLAHNPLHPQIKLLQFKQGTLAIYLSLIAIYLVAQASDSASKQSFCQKKIIPTLRDIETLWASVENIVISNDEPTQPLVIDSTSEPAEDNSEDEETPAPKRRKAAKKSSVKMKSSIKEDMPLMLQQLRQSAARDELLDSDSESEGVVDASADGDRQRRLKKLRFHATQIQQKATKHASANKLSGDTEHFQERRKEREIRLQNEARNRSEKQQKESHAPGEDLSDNEYNDNDLVASRVVNEEEAYYQEISEMQAAKKKKKAVAFEDTDSHGAPGAEMNYVEDGTKRQISRQIEKNRGLTPHRKKENRNPRVKKRKRFEERSKKLSSVKAVYKGGVGKSAYAGEMTGISKVVKSVKLGG